MCFNPKETLGHYSLQPIKHGRSWWFWCGHEALSTLLFGVLDPTHPSKPSQTLVGVLITFGSSCAFRRDLGGACGCPRNFGWRLRMSAKSAGAYALWMEKTSLRPWNGDIDGFRRIFVDSDGVRLILAGFCGTPRFSGGCVQMPAQLL